MRSESLTHLIIQAIKRQWKEENLLFYELILERLKDQVEDQQLMVVLDTKREAFYF